MCSECSGDIQRPVSPQCGSHMAPTQGENPCSSTEVTLCLPGSRAKSAGELQGGSAARSDLGLSREGQWGEGFMKGALSEQGHRGGKA